MKHKKILLIALICLIGIGISVLLFSGHRPFKNLTAEDITSANVRLSPPDTTIQISETEELASYLNLSLHYWSLSVGIPYYNMVLPLDYQQQ
ncbi:MAG: hypothetical protein ACLTHC_02005 [Faecalibacterium sp.]